VKKINVIYFSFFLCLAACNNGTVQLKATTRPMAAYEALDTMPGSVVDTTKKPLSKKVTPEDLKKNETTLKQKPVLSPETVALAKKEAQRLTEEAQQKLLKIEIEKLSASIFYLKDKFGLCYAVLPNSIMVAREQSVDSFASVPCEKVGLADKKS